MNAKTSQHSMTKTEHEPEIVTLGCRLNSFESEVMRRTPVDEDTVIVNTCAVTGEAVRQARQAIRKVRRSRPTAKIVVTGCAAQTDPGEFSAMPEVDLVLGNEEKFDPKRYRSEARVQVGDILQVKEPAAHLTGGDAVSGLRGRARAYVQVQNGCDHRCTFCIIPFGRGNARSVPIDGVVRQVERLVEQGFKEVVLTGVDITSFGNDLGEDVTLGRLVERILEDVPRLPRLRLSSIDSIEVDDILFDHIVGHDRFMPYLHLSLQSGDDMILKRMKRRHSRSESVRFCEQILARRPDVAFGADIIAGFPTETDDMFRNSLSLIDDCHLSYAHVFPYSSRPGTSAARMPPVAASVIKARAAKLRDKAQAAQRAHLDRWSGRRMRVLMEKETVGRGEDFTLVDVSAPQPVGTLQEVDIVRAGEGRVAGEVVT